VHEILTDHTTYSVRILSLRGCKHLNEQKLRGALQYICRASRPEGTPKLKGMYFFGEPISRPEEQQDQQQQKSASPASQHSSPPPVTNTIASTWNARSQQALESSQAEQDCDGDEWYSRKGYQFASSTTSTGAPRHRPINADWAQTLVACHGLIAFDAVLCMGPAHVNSPAQRRASMADLVAAVRAGTMTNLTTQPEVFIPPSAPFPPRPAPLMWAVATYGLEGCSGCGSAPEGWTVWGENEQYPEESTRSSGYEGDHSEELLDPHVGRFPLLGHPPMHSVSVRVAMCPTGQRLDGRRPCMASSTSDIETDDDMTSAGKESRKQLKARFIARCRACLQDRYCVSCNRWWCEACYNPPWAVAAAAAAPHPALGHHSVSHALTANNSSSAVSAGGLHTPFKIRSMFCAVGFGCRARPS
jgi:hypothetical protein